MTDVAAHLIGEELDAGAYSGEGPETVEGRRRHTTWTTPGAVFEEGDVISIRGGLVGQDEGGVNEGAQYQFRPTGPPINPDTLPSGARAIYHDGQWYATRKANALDFVAIFEIPDFDTTLYLIQNFDFLNPDSKIREAATRNLLMFPQQAALATAATISTAGELNEFNLEQFNIAAEDILPGSKSLMAEASDLIASQLKGEIPSDVAELVKIQAAENARNQGVGNIRAGRISARDLGLTSAGLQQTGLENNLALQQMTSNTAASLLTDTGTLVANFANTVVGNTSATPAQTAELWLQSEEHKIHVEQANVGFRVANQAIRNDVNLAIAEIEYINEQNMLNAQQVAIADYQAVRAASHTDLGWLAPVLMIAGTVIGTMVGMPTLGAMIGGAIGGGISGGGQGAAEGAMAGAGSGASMEAAMLELTVALAKAKARKKPTPVIAPTAVPASAGPSSGLPPPGYGPPRRGPTPPAAPGSETAFNVRGSSDVYA